MLPGEVSASCLPPCVGSVHGGRRNRHVRAHAGARRGKDPRGAALPARAFGPDRAGGSEALFEISAMDHVSKDVRSKIMASIRSKGNRTTEVALGRLLWAAGLRG